jgi:hypothetical protein
LLGGGNRADAGYGATGHGFGSGNRQGYGRRGGITIGSGGRSEDGYATSGFGFGSGNRQGYGRGGGWASGSDARYAGERGEYGGAYEEYGGWPGDAEQGMTYGGGGYGASRPSQGRGYDGGYAREPFMPEEAYRRHPEYRQERQPREWEAHQHAYGEELDDKQVRKAVYRRMEMDAWLDPQRIDVQVEDGVVTLTGEVDDFLEARYAWDDAWEAEGVRGVVNNLAVRSDQPHDAHGDIVPQSAGDRSSEADAG